jgi:ribonuclease HII
MKIIGIDDAGRGPVIGPMILCGVMIDSLNDEEKLNELGVKDSKLLFPKKRAKIAKSIKDSYKYHVEVVSPKEIDDFPNLNNLEAIKCGIIINKFLDKLNEKVKVIVDCPSVNTKAWGEYLFDTIVKKEFVELVCEHKADFNHLIVGGASIVAKETREEELQKLKKELDVDFGSGYPSDPVTKDFLVKYFGEKKYDEIIRKSWSTYKRVAEKFGQKKLFYL